MNYNAKLPKGTDITRRLEAINEQLKRIKKTVAPYKKVNELPSDVTEYSVGDRVLLITDNNVYELTTENKWKVYFENFALLDEIKTSLDEKMSKNVEIINDEITPPLGGLYDITFEEVQEYLGEELTYQIFEQKAESISWFSDGGIGGGYELLLKVSEESDAYRYQWISSCYQLVATVTIRLNRDNTFDIGVSADEYNIPLDMGYFDYFEEKIRKISSQISLPVTVEFNVNYIQENINSEGRINFEFDFEIDVLKPIKIDFFVYEGIIESMMIEPLKEPDMLYSYFDGHYYNGNDYIYSIGLGFDMYNYIDLDLKSFIEEFVRFDASHMKVIVTCYETTNFLNVEL